MFVYFPRIRSALGSKLCCILSTPEYVEEGFYGGSCNSVRCCCIADENAIFDHSFNFLLARLRQTFIPLRTISLQNKQLLLPVLDLLCIYASVCLTAFVLFVFVLYSFVYLLDCFGLWFCITWLFVGILRWSGWLVGWVGLFVTPFEERDNHIVVAFFSPKERARCSELLAYGPVGGCLGGTHGVLMGRGGNFC